MNPIYHPSQIDCAYSAGFFDGEGTIDIRYRKTHGGKYERFELRVAIIQLKTEVLHWHRARWGGLIQPPTAKNNCSKWVITDASAGRYLMAIQSFLQGKSSEAAIALGFAMTLNRTFKCKGVPPEIRAMRLQCFNDVRQLRADAGIRPSGNRDPLSASRAIRGLSCDDEALADISLSQASWQNSSASERDDKGGPYL